MISELQKKKILTDSKISNFEICTESIQRSHLSRYLREIPRDFKEIAIAPDKKKRIKDHLWSFYDSEPKDWEVEAVLKRIITLKQVTEYGRDLAMNKTAQSHFKKENWEKVKRCKICGVVFLDFNAVTLDHIIPVWIGGLEEHDNWQLTCKLCNTQKDDHWGSGDISRVGSMKRVDGGFFKSSAEDILKTLRSKKNPSRYWILQRDESKCQIDNCNSSSLDETMVICCIGDENLPTIDQLKSVCITCAKNKKYKHSEMYDKNR